MDTITLNKPRIQSIDLLRGLVMVIMALDHVRDFFHAASFDPTDLSKTSVVLFGTRWITHFCAPVFMFLSGTSAFISGQKKTKKELSLFLLKRGLWLIFLELTVVGFGWSFNVHFDQFGFLVIWALGASMIALSVLVWLPFKIILFIGLLLVCGHNLLDNVHVHGNSLKAFAWSLLHEGGNFSFKGISAFVMYPVMSWIGVMALGYCLGSLYAKDPMGIGFDAAKRKKILVRLGLSVIVVFIALRFSNLYGDASLWSSQPDAAFTVLSFLNTTKYPPSLLYITMTLGPALLFLAYSENIANGFSNFIKVFGRVPMFYYLCHLYLVHITAMLSALFIQRFKASDFENGDIPQGYGYNLGIVYLVWVLIILTLYLPCKWYDRYKTSHRENKWLSYL